MDGDRTAAAAHRTRVPNDLSRTILAALPSVPVLIALAGMAVGLRALWPSPRFSTAAAFSVLASLALSGFVALTRRRRPRAGVVAACHAAAWSPLLAACAWQSIAQEIVSRPMRGCDTGLMGLVMLGLPVVAIFLLFAGIGAGVLFARPVTDRALRVVAAGATGLALVAFAFATVRLARPDPDTYLGSLEPVTDLQGGSTTVIAGRELRYDKIELRAGVPVRTMEGGEVLPPSTECTLTGLDQPITYSSTSATGSCVTLRVRTDRGHDIVVVEASPDGYERRDAFRPSDGTVISISPSTVADHIAPPIGWVISAGIGGLIGAACVFAASRLRRRAATLDARDAKHTGDGWVELETGEALRVSAAQNLPVGAVVLGNVGEQLPTYRQMGTPTFGTAWQGTLDDLRGELTDLAASLDSLAIAASVLGGVPLLVARLVAGL